jgi:hypothetical protein
MPESATLVYPLRMPARPGYVEVTWRMDSVVQVLTSPFTFAQKTNAWPGQRWGAAVKLPEMQPVLGREWIAFFASLNGLEGTFLLRDSAFALREVGDGLGYPETDGAQVAGKVVTTKGWTPSLQVLRAGDMIEIAGRLRRVLLNVHSDDDGKAILNVWPNIIALGDGVPVEWLEPKGLFRLDAEVETVWNRNRNLASLTFACTEVL